MRKCTCIDLRNVEVRICRYFDGVAVRDYICLKYGSNIYKFTNFIKFFKFLEEKLRNRDVVEMIYNELDMRDLCVRCGTCCSTGCPPISLEDSDRIFKSRFRDYVINTFRNLTNLDIYDNVELFIIWNSHIQILKPCPFLKFEKYALCTIYDARPELCRIFKCWSPRVDNLRREVLSRILNDLDSVHEGKFEKFKSIALENIISMYRYLF